MIGHDLSKLASLQASFMKRPQDFDDFELNKDDYFLRKAQLDSIRKRIHYNWN